MDYGGVNLQRAYVALSSADKASWLGGPGAGAIAESLHISERDLYVV